jgi:hypothetical protein
MHILNFSKFVSSQPEPCEQNHEFLLRRANWSWTDALDPLDRDSLVAVNPGFIRRLYHQWSLEFMDYEVPIAVDLLSRYEVSCTPFNPLQLSSSLSLPVLPSHIAERVERALILAGQMRQEPVDRTSALNFFAEAYMAADREFGVQEAIKSGNNFQLPMGEMIRDLAAVAECGGSLVDLASRSSSQEASSNQTKSSACRTLIGSSQLGWLHTSDGPTIRSSNRFCSTSSSRAYGY